MSKKFMASVKFYIPKGIKSFCDNFAGQTSDDGLNFSFFVSWDGFNSSKKQLVSFFEVFPEHIPDGMRYNKELDKLVPDVMQWEKVDNGGNHIAADGTPFDTIEEALNHNCTLVATSSADEYCSGIKVELEKVMDYTDKKENSPIEPNHYTEMKISPLEYIEANQSDFTWCIANIIKYVSRHKRKNGIEDLKKAQWYLNHEINRLEIIEGIANAK